MVMIFHVCRCSKGMKYISLELLAFMKCIIHAYVTPGTLMTSAADVINHNGRTIDQTYTILICKDDGGSIVEPTSSLV